jgi:hypothetical protein
MKQSESKMRLVLLDASRVQANKSRAHVIVAVVGSSGATQWKVKVGIDW